MKNIFFHLQGYRDLPDDFERRYESIYVTPPTDDLCDPELVAKYLNWNMDELELADELGFDGLGVNEHHQNGYGFANSPNLMAAILARRKSSAALVIVGNTLPLYNPPVRVGEEFAILDCMSGGRVIAGLPIGTPPDTTLCYGITPTEVRPRYYEAHDLLKQSWTRPGPFAFNGRFTKLRYVNPWPKPLQKPHPPIWLAGGGSVETWDFAAANDYTYSFLSYLGHGFADMMMKGYWDALERHGRDDNPYRAGFAQVVVVGDTDAEAERLYTPHLKYFYEKSMLFAPHHFNIPGYNTRKTVEAMIKKAKTTPVYEPGTQTSWKELVDEHRVVIGGSPDTVVDQLTEAIKRLRVGHMMLLLQVGSMDNELTTHNLTLFGEQVLPRIRHIWDDEGWEDHWWPQAANRSADVATAPST